MIQKSTKDLHFQGKLKSFFNWLKDWLTLIRKDSFIATLNQPTFSFLKPSLSVTLKWADFGLTKETDDFSTYEMSGVKGTIYWMAPEILAHFNGLVPNCFTTLTDVFSTGCLFFKILTGVHPFGNNIFTDIPQNIQLNNPNNFSNRSKYDPFK